MVSRTTFLVAAWLGMVVLVPVACFEGAPPSDGGDASSDAAVDAGIDWTDTDASLALRARALLGGATCSNGPTSGCHAESAGGTDLRINDTSSFGIIDVPSTEKPDVMRVVPFQPESSYLYWKVTGDPRTLEGGLIMPAASPTLNGTVDPRVVALVGPWIEAGAP